MALIFQEVLTLVVRLRANRQRFSDLSVFRRQVRNAFENAEADGARLGYATDHLRMATLAVVAFLDESVLNSQNAALAEWQRNPLQEELFGARLAGEIFFSNVEFLLAWQDSEPVADLLEVHQICMLLGFRGRHAANGTAAEIRSIIERIEEKIRRIRGVAPAPPWQFLPRPLRAPVDERMPLLRLAAICCAILAMLLFVVLKLLLLSSAKELAGIAAG